MFIDLSETFDTVDHTTLLKKLELYGLEAKNLSWIKNSQWIEQPLRISLKKAVYKYFAIFTGKHRGGGSRCWNLDKEVGHEKIAQK